MAQQNNEETKMGKAKRWFKSAGEKIAWPLLGLGAAVGIGMLGYKLGGDNTELRISYGLDKVFKNNPELEQPMTDAVQRALSEEKTK